MEGWAWHVCIGRGCDHLAVSSFQAPDQRGTTPLLAAYKNGHLEVVEWLLAHVAHLPSDPECNKALLAPMPSDTDLAPQRSKCIELIMKVRVFVKRTLCHSDVTGSTVLPTGQEGP